MGRTSEQTLHSFPQPFKQPGVTMETPLCMFPNYPNPLHILSHTQRVTHRNTKRHKHTLFGRTIPFPLPCIPTQSTFMQAQGSSTSPPALMCASPGLGLVLTAGTSSFLTSLMARWSLILARLCVSSTVIRTWRSSLRCSQLGFPRFISSWRTKTGLFQMHRLAAPTQMGGEGLCFSSRLARRFEPTSNPADTELGGGRGPQLWTVIKRCSAVTQVGCCSLLKAPRTRSLQSHDSLPGFSIPANLSATSLIFRGGLDGNKSASRRGTVNSR